MRALALWILRTYKRWLSPLLPVSCRYVPTCSEYAMEAVERFGILRGGFMAAGRLLRCHPFVKGGHDPVPAEKANAPGTKAPDRDIAFIAAVNRCATQNLLTMNDQQLTTND